MSDIVKICSAFYAHIYKVFFSFYSHIFTAC